MSNIVRGSRRCSGVLAWELHLVTGVPVKNIGGWGKHRRVIDEVIGHDSSDEATENEISGAGD
jgi:hypothetical protein